MSHVKWMSIPNFHSLRRALDLYAESTTVFRLPVVDYRAKIKLHGVNAGVQVKPSGQVIAQSRRHFITDDRYGFARWVKENESYFASLAVDSGPFTIHGEWCGPGIMKGTAVNLIDRKSFVVFSAMVNDQTLHTDPDILRVLLIPPINTPRPKDLYVLPWLHSWFRINFADTSQMLCVAADLDDMVVDVECEDPWVKKNFGISGLGEGLVFYPQDFTGPHGPRLNISRNLEMIGHYIFKAKGKEHAVIKHKTPVQVDPEVAASAAEFVELVVTVPRLEQGLEEGCKGKVEMKMMGPFLKWIGQDIKNECQAELEAAGLAWKDVGKAVATAAREWLTAKVGDHG